MRTNFQYKKLYLACAQASLLLFTPLALSADETAQNSDVAPEVVQQPVAATSATTDDAQQATSGAETTAQETAEASDQSEASADPDKRREEIVVTGYRLSLEKALAQKRASRQFMESIMSEDMGKTPDQNVAEALQRVTGIQIQRTFGSGSEVSVRGLSPDLNKVTINGRTVTNGGDDNSVDFEGFAAEAFDGIEVFKTPAANQTEGSLGGTINLKTKRPLDIGKREFRLSSKATYSEKSEETDPKFTISYNDVFFDNTFGVRLTFGQEQTHLRKNEVNNDAYKLSGDQFLNADGSFKNDGLARQIKEDILGLANGSDEYNATNVAVSSKSKVVAGDRETDRVDIALAFQYAPTDDTSFYLEGTYNKLDKDSLTTTMSIDPSGDIIDGFGGFDNSWDYDRGIATFDGTILNNKNEWLQQEDTNFTLGLGFDHVAGRWTFKGDVGVSRAKAETPRSIQANAIPQVNKNGCAPVPTPGVKPKKWPIVCGDVQTSELPITFLYNESDPDWLLGSWSTTLEDTPNADTTFDPTNNDNWIINSVLLEDKYTTDEEDVAQFDVDYQFDQGFVESVEFGVRYAKRTKDRNGSGNVNIGFDTPLPLSAYAESDFLFDDVGEGRAGVFENGWAMADVEAVEGVLDANYRDDIGFDPLQQYIIEESTTAAYGMVNFTDASGRLSGNFGIRYVRTGVDTQSSKIEGDVISDKSTDNSYTNILPSLNMRFNFTEDLVGRFAVGRTMARPRQKKLSPKESVNVNKGKVSVGNPFLEATEADQLDIGIEWYFQGNNSAILSLTYFRKELKSFLLDTTVAGAFQNQDGTFYTLDINGDPGDDEFTGLNSVLQDSILSDGQCSTVVFPNIDDNRQCFDITSTINADAGALIEGLELNYQHPLTFLPSPFDGLGINFNYTYTDGSTDLEDPIDPGSTLKLPGLSRNSYNVALWYEKYGFSFRAAYNYRDEYLKNQDLAGDKSLVNDSYYQLDISMGYVINKDLAVQFEALNVTDQNKLQYNGLVGASAVTLDQYVGSRYSLGVNYKF